VFLPSGIPRCMPLELTRVTFITLLKGNWFLGTLLSHKLLSLERCLVSGSLVGVPRWLPMNGFSALGSALRAINRYVLTHPWYMCYSKDLILLLVVRWSASQVSDTTRNSPPPLSNLGGQVFSWSLQSP
jgi:hypothetical protein